MPEAKRLINGFNAIRRSNSQWLLGCVAECGWPSIHRRGRKPRSNRSIGNNRAVAGTAVTGYAREIDSREQPVPRLTAELTFTRCAAASTLLRSTSSVVHWTMLSNSCTFSTLFFCKEFLFQDSLFMKAYYESTPTKDSWDYCAPNFGSYF